MATNIHVAHRAPGWIGHKRYVQLRESVAEMDRILAAADEALRKFEEEATDV